MKNYLAYRSLLLMVAALTSCSSSATTGTASKHTDNTIMHPLPAIPDTINAEVMIMGTMPVNQQEQLKPFRKTSGASTPLPTGAPL